MSKTLMKAEKPGKVEVLGPESEELTITRETSTALQTFVRGAIAFFTTARRLELRAEATLARARAIKPPTDAATDEALQRELKQSNKESKEAEDHWTPINSAMAGYHKWTVARRRRATDRHDEVKSLLQPMHNAYVESEKRRVAAETERLRLAAEQKAREDRQAELDRMEAEAFAAEAASPTLSASEQAYVREYDALIGKSYHSGEVRHCAVQACIRAGYKKPELVALKMLEAPKILAAISAMVSARAIREQAAAVKEAPLEVAVVPEVKANVTKTAGTHDRTTWSGQVVDLAAARAAWKKGTYDIPDDIWVVDPTRLNELARLLQKNLDRMPGLRAVPKTTTI